MAHLWQTSLSFIQKNVTWQLTVFNSLLFCSLLVYSVQQPYLMLANILLKYQGLEFQLNILFCSGQAGTLHYYKTLGVFFYDNLIY